MRMKEEDKKYLQEILENSDIRSSRETLKKLAENMVSYKEFQTFLQQHFETDVFDSSYVILKIISLWTSCMGDGATLAKFEWILRCHHLNAEAGN